MDGIGWERRGWWGWAVWVGMGSDEWGRRGFVKVGWGGSVGWFGELTRGGGLEGGGASNGFRLHVRL